MAVILSGPVLQLDSFPLLESSSVIPICLDDECRYMNASRLIAIHLQEWWSRDAVMFLNKVALFI